MAAFSLKCFGVGDGWPSGERNHSSYLYRFGAQSLLIDCGESISRNYKASGLDYDLIDRIFVSHLHFDHVGGLFMLLQGFWLEGRKKDLWVHAPAGGIAALRHMLEAAGLFDELLPFAIQYQPLQPKQPVISSSVRITPFATSHLAQLQKRFEAKYPQRYEAYSFLIESGQVRVGHSADIGAVEDLVPLVEHPLDFLVCELAHVEPETLFRFLQGRPIGRILFVHLAREWAMHLAEVQVLARKWLRFDRVEWPLDGQEFAFPAPADRDSE